MTSDPRSLNRTPEGKSPFEYFEAYGRELQKALQTVDPTQYAQAFDIIIRTSNAGGRFFIAGNGGSSAIADHLCCDFTKGTHFHNHPPLRTQSLSSNGALLTALANDFSYAEAFSKQLEMLAESKDCLIVISSSGNSPNVIQALEHAKKIGMKCIAFSGFSGGKVAQYADAHLYVAYDNYGIVEDAHQAIMHAISQFITRQRK